MSGGDYSTPAGTSGIGGDGESDCASLFDRTILNSPDPNVLSQLGKGDVLPLILREDGGRKILLAVTQEGAPAGSVTSALLSRLVNCIEIEGVGYVAIVENIDGGKCTVQIRPEAE